MQHCFLSDDELLTAIRSDDHGALRAVFERYWVRLYKTAYKLTKDEEGSKEIVHDVFINIWERRAHLVIESLPAFLLTAVRYQYYNRCRLATSNLVLVDDYAGLEHKPSYNDGEVRLAEAELHNKLKHHLLPLPQRCREIFLLSRTEHLSNDEIANRLRISKRTVENQLSTALHHLRTVLSVHKSLLVSILSYLWH